MIRTIQAAVESFAPSARVVEWATGGHWLGVRLAVGGLPAGGTAAGLASAENQTGGFSERAKAMMKEASPEELIAVLDYHDASVRMVALATVNALNEARLRSDPAAVPELHETPAERMVMEAVPDAGATRIAMVGHFPFVANLRGAGYHVDVLELEPQPGDLPAEAAPEIIPSADALILPGMTIVNGTCRDLMALRRDGSVPAYLVGASTPLVEGLFHFGFAGLAGARVIDDDTVFAAIRAGKRFRSMTGAVRRVTLQPKEAAR